MKQRLVVAHGGATGAALCFFPARHPRTSGRIMLGLRGKELLEVHQAGGNAQTSWLLGGLECAIQDGAIYFATPLDALFILLPLLETARGAAGGEHRGLFKPLSDIFGPDDASLEERLASLPGLNEKLAAICDVNDKYDELMVRLSDDKVLGWLQRKTQALRAHLAQQQPSSASTAAPAARRPTLSQFELEEDSSAEGAPGAAARAALRSACLLVSEYLSDGWAERLRAALGLSVADMETRAAARPLATSPMGSNAPQKVAPEPPPKRYEQPPVAKKVKALEPLKKGQKTMGAFFIRKA